VHKIVKVTENKLSSKILCCNVRIEHKNQRNRSEGRTIRVTLQLNDFFFSSKWNWMMRHASVNL
jgi:hypothetical protein